MSNFEATTKYQQFKTYKFSGEKITFFQFPWLHVLDFSQAVMFITGLFDHSSYIVSWFYGVFVKILFGKSRLERILTRTVFHH